MLKYIVLFLSTVLLISCGDDSYLPKQRGYYHIDLPEKEYKPFSGAGFPYTFDVPVYAKATPDTTYFGETPDSPYWLNLFYPSFNAQINITYKGIKNIDELDKLVADTYKLTFKHTVKADYIDEYPISKPGLGGMLYEVGGNAASPLQFFVTDSADHFLRGALYFYAEPNADSVAPVVEFIKEDVLQLISTIEWK